MSNVTLPDQDFAGWKRNIILFLISQTISLFGSSLVQYAIMWHITLETQSGVMMTVYILAGLLPTFFVAPFAGVWADRYPRRLLIIFADALIAVATLIVALLFIGGHDALWLLFAVATIRAIGSGVQTPSVGAILPQIVPPEQLTRIGGINGTIQAVIVLVSPIASGALLAMSDIETIFFVDVVTAAIAIIVLTFFLKVRPHAKALENNSTGYYADLRQGWDYVSSHSFLKVFFAYSAAYFVLIAPAAFLTPLQVTRSFGPDVWRLTAIELAFALGMMLGGALIAAWGGFRNKAHTMTLSMIANGIGVLGLGVVPIFPIYLVIMGVIGVTVPLFNTPANVLLQERVEEDYLGRVFGVQVMIATSMMPLGMLVFGPLADVVKIEWMLIGTGALLIVQGILLLCSRTMLVAGEPAALPPDPPAGGDTDAAL